MSNVKKVGDTVNHWFAGDGIIRRLIGVVCFINWNDGRSGWAWTKDCKKS